MKRRKFILLSSVAFTLPWLTSSLAQAAQAGTRIGAMSVSQFQRVNREGIATVAAVPPGGGPLTAADRTLMAQLAAGGMMQLEMSRLALTRANSPDVRILAQAEVEEQTGLNSKLLEIAASRNFSLRMPPRAPIASMLARLERLTGAQFDQAYVLESGIRGHELLDAATARVLAQAQDPALLSVATAARPLILTHLQVSQAEASQLGVAVG